MNKVIVKIRYCLSGVNSYFNKKNTLLIFLLLLVGVSLPALSGTASTNFWYRLYCILCSPFFNFFFFLAIGLNIIYVASELSTNYTIVNRYSDFKLVIKKNITDIVVSTLLLAFVSLILAISGAVVFSFGNLGMINHPIYNIPIAIYIFLKFIITCFISCTINSTIYLLLILFKRTGTIVLILLMNSLFLIMNAINSPIVHFYNMPILYHYYFLSIPFSNLFLEIVCSILEYFFLTILTILVYKIVIRKKRELI